ncbi:hypothetical protein NPX13_g2916 [Xylaria arbuscula]|uniref:Uncharacterized protein n=1 Tax=Xylaria arbuscula TaxID=114810 RepID=A0A9W8NIA7_9PEZI|nr:hypothetical protein NPX13_g2916 [Xylaria arbuscula]
MMQLVRDSKWARCYTCRQIVTMEAIAAAGALPGLASATIQLGTATFQFYQQLHGLYKAIKHGERDLSTAIRKLDQHGDFIKELRFNFEHIADASIPATTRDLFERCIVDSEAEVEEFRSLLDRVGKHHFKKKTWNAIETGSRLRFHEDSIQKYYDLLDKQMHRFLFLQSSVQSMRVESSLSEVMATLVKQGAKAANFYDKHSSVLDHGSRLRSSLGTGSNEEQVLMRRTKKKNNTASSLEDIVTLVWSYQTTKTFSTLCGTVSVTTFGRDNDCLLAYKIWFEPYSWISRTLVEWRCLVDSIQKAPTMVFSVTTSIICNNPDVLDALGLVPLKEPYYSYRYPIRFCWIMRVPKLSKVRALLDTGRLLKDHVLCLFNLAPMDIITAFLSSLKPAHEYPNPETRFYHSEILCAEASLDYLRQQYLGYYRVTELLLSYGFLPHLSSWQQIYDQAARNHHHISTRHPGLAESLGLSLKSIPFLILETVGYIIPLDYKLVFHGQLGMQHTLLLHTGVLGKFSFHYLDSDDSRVSYFGHLITQEGSLEKIKEILEIDPLDLTDDGQGIFDRWLLGLLAPFRPDIASLIKTNFSSRHTIPARNYFHIDYIREEFRQAPTRANEIQRLCFLKFICSYGNLAIVRQLDIAALTRREIQHMLCDAAQSSSPELFDLLLGHNSGIGVNDLVHTRIMRDKIASDSSFLDRYHQMLEDCERSPLATILNDGSIISTLLLPKSQPLPDYIRCVTLSEARRFGTSLPVTGEEIPLLIYKGMTHYWHSKAPTSHLLQDLHFYNILRLLVRSSAYEPYLDKSCSTRQPAPMDVIPGKSNSFKLLTYPSVEGYSSLMLALHCGMKPAVQILVDAGVSITKPMCCGKSPVRLARENAQSQHPRRWVAYYDATSGAEVSAPSWITNHPEDVSEDIDQDMLEILLQALRDRGEVEIENPNELPTPSKWMSLREKVDRFTAWLFRPSYIFDPDTFRENSIFVVLTAISTCRHDRAVRMGVVTLLVDILLL